jgi:hypothetical protein
MAAQGPRSVSDAEFAKFQAWRARTQAAAATGVAPDAEDGDEGEWDDEEYEMGAVALPVEEVQVQRRGLAMAAAGTKAGAEKARATRAAKQGLDQAATQQQAPAPAARSQTGTAQIAGPVDLAALHALQSRRDKLAARERLAKLPNHGRNVAPQGLNRLPKGFPVGGGAMEIEQPRTVPRVGAIGTASRRVGAAARLRAGVTQSGTAGQGVGALGLPTCETCPVLTGGVTLSVLSFFELAGRAGLDLAAVTTMARGNQAQACHPVPGVQPIRHPADGAAIARGVGAGGGEPSPTVPAVRLSPIAVRVQEARENRGVGQGNAGGEGANSGAGARDGPAGGAGPCSRPMEQERAESSAMDAARGAAEAKARSARAPAAREDTEQAESSAMGAARGIIEADERVARALAAQERAKHSAMQGELITSISRDAELAMELVAHDAEANGVSQGEAFRAQSVGQRVVGPQRSGAPAGDKGKAKVSSSTPTAKEQGAVLVWEKMLSKGAWSGAEELAEVVVQPSGNMVMAAATRAQALTCFAEGRPLVSPSKRTRVEGVPDWVDNSAKVV